MSSLGTKKITKVLQGEVLGESKKSEVQLPSSYDPLKRYLQEVAHYPLLTPEEELELALKLRENGDLEAARRLVRANLRLVVKIAMEYRNAYHNALDLIQEGNVGLMKAVSKFDPAKGAKLSYYASWWIRSYILKYMIDNFRLVKMGTTQAQKKLFYQLMKEKERLENQGLEAGTKLLADRLHVKEKEVIEMGQRLASSGIEMSLDAPMDSDGSQTTFQDRLEDKRELPDISLAKDQLLNILKDHLGDFAKSLNARELVIFRERLASDEPRTLQEVGDQFGMTRERVRQIEVRLIEKMQEFYADYFRLKDDQGELPSKTKAPKPSPVKKNLKVK